LFCALEFMEDRQRKRPFDPAAKVNERIKDHALRAGVGVYPTGGTIDGLVGDHVLVAPPYIARSADIEEIVDRLEVAIRSMFRELLRA
jgi:adenosylmethionine-8-amino-7-oxononanoate aminotransferase